MKEKNTYLWTTTGKIGTLEEHYHGSTKPFHSWYELERRRGTLIIQTMYEAVKDGVSIAKAPTLAALGSMVGYSGGAASFCYKLNKPTSNGIIFRRCA